MAVRTIGTNVKLTGEKEFNDGMKAMNSNLKTLRTDMAAVSAEFDGNADSMEALAAKQKVLQQSVEQHQAKVDALRQKYEQVKGLYGENSAQADKYKQQLNQATVALNKETTALEKNADALKEKQLSTLKSIAAGAKNVFSGISTAAGSVAKGVGLISAASAAGVAAIGAGGVIALGTMVSMAREAAEAAKAAQEAGEVLTESQQQWLAYSNQLDALDASVANAKGALAGVLLPVLGDLSTEGAAFLNDFSRDMQAAAGDTGKQTQVLSDYIVKGAKLIKDKLPEYIQTGKELFQGLGEGLSESGPELLDIGIDLVMDLLDGIIEYWFLYLYHDGSFGSDHYSSITGANSAKCSISYNDGYFEVISMGVCYVYEVLGPVQLSSFSSLKMTAQQLTDNYSAKVCIFVGSTAEATYNNNAGFAQLSLSPTEGIRDIVLDVSALSGEYYIFAGAYEVSTQATSRKTRIYEIIAE